MTNITNLHREAMDLVDRGATAKIVGEHELANRYLQEAFEKEREAALLFFKDNAELEPTRSVLFRSAASLALQAGETREAERLIALGLSGNPPEEIADELRDLLENVNFQRHLELRGITLQSNEIQLSLAGASVGFGIANSTEFIYRVANLERVVYRTMERKIGRPYRDRGGPAADVKEQLALYISVPRAASFSVTLRLGHTQQLALPGMDLADEVIEEVLECLTLFNSHNLEALQTKINNPSYYRNFIALAENVAPDGKNIHTVGITSIRQGVEKRIVLRHAERSSFEVKHAPADRKKQRRIQVKGSLRFADALKENRSIKIIDDKNKTYRVQVPEGLMDDIVKPMWGTEVVITGSWTRGVIHMEHIEQATEK